MHEREKKQREEKKTEKEQGMLYTTSMALPRLSLKTNPCTPTRPKVTQ